MQRGFTPLYFASRYNHTDVVDLLLASGADINKVEHCNVSTQCSTTSQATMWIAPCDTQLFSLYRVNSLHCILPLKSAVWKPSNVLSSVVLTLTDHVM